MSEKEELAFAEGYLEFNKRCCGSRKVENHWSDEYKSQQHWGSNVLSKGIPGQDRPERGWEWTQSHDFTGRMRTKVS